MRTLQVHEKQKTTYCIPLEKRDRQMAYATQRITARLQPHARRDEAIAVVGFGPSLVDTWEQVRNFPYVISCSGSHKFLVERGIIPTWHVEVDPRQHKVALIGPPQRQTTYLISSTCHKAVFDHLEGYDVRLWHVFDASASGQRLLPPGEYALTGGCDVGLRALVIAAFCGFRDLHVFGLDGCARDGTKHAGPHPNAIVKYDVCEYDGVTYQTTPGLLAAAQQIAHELDQLPKVRATFYGEGLVQHLARGYTPKPVQHSMANVVAFQKVDPISALYPSGELMVLKSKTPAAVPC